MRAQSYGLSQDRQRKWGAYVITAYTQILRKAIAANRRSKLKYVRVSVCVSTYPRVSGLCAAFDDCPRNIALQCSRIDFSPHFPFARCLPTGRKHEIHAECHTLFHTHTQTHTRAHSTSCTVPFHSRWCCSRTCVRQCMAANRLRNCNIAERRTYHRKSFNILTPMWIGRLWKFDALRPKSWFFLFLFFRCCPSHRYSIACILQYSIVCVHHHIVASTKNTN